MISDVIRKERLHTYFLWKLKSFGGSESRNNSVAKSMLRKVETILLEDK